MNPIRPDTQQDETHLLAYNRILAQALSELKDNDDKTGTALLSSINAAKEREVALGEVSAAEAERIAAYVRRDLEDAGGYLATSGQNDLKSWFQFDVQLIETQLLEMFMEAADQTKLAYLQLAQEATGGIEYQSGEITTAGTLQCANCGERLHFHTTRHIPACPACQRTTFLRKGPEDAVA